YVIAVVALISSASTMSSRPWSRSASSAISRRLRGRSGITTWCRRMRGGGGRDGSRSPRTGESHRPPIPRFPQRRDPKPTRSESNADIGSSDVKGFSYVAAAVIVVVVVTVGGIALVGAWSPQPDASPSYAPPASGLHQGR